MIESERVLGPRGVAHVMPSKAKCEQNTCARTFYLLSPDKKKYTATNLLHFVRENTKLFPKGTTDWRLINAAKVAEGYCPNYTCTAYYSLHRVSKLGIPWNGWWVWGTHDPTAEEIKETILFDLAVGFKVKKSKSGKYATLEELGNKHSQKEGVMTPHEYYLLELCCLGMTLGMGDIQIKPQRVYRDEHLSRLTLSHLQEEAMQSASL